MTAQKRKQVAILGSLLGLLVLVQLFGPLGNMLFSTQPQSAEAGEVAPDKSPKTSQHTSITWQRPAPVPGNLRDPMVLKLSPRPEPQKINDPPENEPSTGPTTGIASALTAFTLDPNHTGDDSEPIDIMTARTDSRGAPVQLDDSTPVFYLKGIIYSSSNRSSIITDTGILRTGDVIHGATLVKIDPRMVEFQKHEQTYIVRVGEKPQESDAPPSAPD